MAPSVGVGVGVGLMASGAHRPQPPSQDLLAGWFRADDPDITLVSTKVSAIPNRGALGGTLAQGTDANRPTYSAADANFNSRPSVTFDDVNDVLVSSLAATNWAFMHDGTGAVIAMMLRPTGDGVILSTEPTGSPNGIGTRFEWDRTIANHMYGVVYNGTGTQWHSVFTPLASGTAAVWVQSTETGGTPELSGRVNGSEGSQGSGSGSAVATDPDSTLVVGGLSAAPSHPAGFSMTELLIYDGLPTKAEVESYLTSLYL